MFRIGLTKTFELRLIQEVFQEEIKSDFFKSKNEGFGPLAVGGKFKISEENGLIPEAAFLTHVTIPTGKDIFQPQHAAMDFRFIGENTLSEKWGFAYNFGGEWSGDDLLFTGIYTAVLGTDITNQGGIFIINEDENNNTTLELTGCYAYGRQKFLEKIIKPGEGLVGQCYLERQPIFITDVPQGYTKIQFGLGDSTPNCIYIFPLIVNDEIYGILEIASFEIFTDTQKEFLEKVSESIAATLKNAKTGSVTTKLLAEAQEMAEVMSQQEDEMRQNMEEMQATSETMNQMVEQKDSEIAELKKQIRLLNS